MPRTDFLHEVYAPDGGSWEVVLRVEDWPWGAYTARLYVLDRDGIFARMLDDQHLQWRVLGGFSPDGGVYLGPGPTPLMAVRAVASALEDEAFCDAVEVVIARLREQVLREATMPPGGHGS
jgi:hypothetical protein